MTAWRAILAAASRAARASTTTQKTAAAGACAAATAAAAASAASLHRNGNLAQGLSGAHRGLYAAAVCAAAAASLGEFWLVKDTVFNVGKEAADTGHSTD